MSRDIQPVLSLQCGPERCDDCAFLQQGRRRLREVPWHCVLFGKHIDLTSPSEKPERLAICLRSEDRLCAERLGLRRRLNDAIAVLNGMGLDRDECPHCGRRTVITGRTCFGCGK